MKNFLFGLFIVLSPFPSLAEGGSKGGNGGGGVLCRDRSGKITRVEEYDLVEATRTEKWAVIDMKSTQTAGAIEKAAWENVRILEPGMESLMRTAYAQVNQRWTPVKKVPRIYDVTVKNLPSGCHFVQLADWDNTTEKLWVNQALFQKMLPIHQVALKFHEAIYFLFRQRAHIKTSDDTKYDIAVLFQPTSAVELARLVEEKAQMESQLKKGYSESGPSVWEFKTKGIEECWSGFGPPKSLLLRKTCLVNWPRPEDYASKNEFVVTLNLLSGWGKARVSVNGEVFSQEISYFHPTSRIPVKNLLSVPNPYGSDFQGHAKVDVFNEGDHMMVFEVAITSRASGQTYRSNQNIYVGEHLQHLQIDFLW